MTLEAESNIAGVEIDDRLLTTAATHTHDRATFSQGLTPRLRKSLVNFEIQSLFLLKFETPETK